MQVFQNGVLKDILKEGSDGEAASPGVPVQSDAGRLLNLAAEATARIKSLENYERTARELGHALMQLQELGRSIPVLAEAARVADDEYHRMYPHDNFGRYVGFVIARHLPQSRGNLVDGLAGSGLGNRPGSRLGRQVVNSGRFDRGLRQAEAARASSWVSSGKIPNDTWSVQDAEAQRRPEPGQIEAELNGPPLGSAPGSPEALYDGRVDLLARGPVAADIPAPEEGKDLSWALEPNEGVANSDQLHNWVGIVVTGPGQPGAHEVELPQVSASPGPAGMASIDEWEAASAKDL